MQSLDLSSLAPAAPQPTLLRLLASPTIASKRWVYRQYDTMVRTNTIALAGLTARASSASREPTRALAISTDGNGRYCYLNPRRGAMLALAEAARNVACAGGVPIGATNCLNFGNPERPEIMWQFVEAIEGLAEACRALDIPITGGNVSLYNETDGSAIYPTPDHRRRRADRGRARACSRRTFKARRRRVILLGENRGELGGSRVSEGRPRPGARRRPGARSRSRSARCSGSSWTSPRAGLAALGARLLRRRPRGRRSPNAASMPAASGVRSTCSLRASSARSGALAVDADAVRRVGVAHRRVGVAASTSARS